MQPRRSDFTVILFAPVAVGEQAFAVGIEKIGGPQFHHIGGKGVENDDTVVTGGRRPSGQPDCRHAFHQDAERQL